MSIGPAVPPSIPPRKKAGGSPGARPSPSEPRIVSPAKAGPIVTAEPSAPAQSTSPTHPETPAASSAMTGAMKRVLKSASSAVAGATAVVTGESARTAGSSPTSAGASRLDSTKAAPTIASTDLHPTTATTPRDPDGAAVLPGASGAPGSVRTPAAARVPAGGSTSASVPMPAPSVGRDGAPRRVRLSISRVDPWSVMKLSFLLSVAIGIMIVVAAAVVWFVLDGLTVFTKVNDMIMEIVGAESEINFLQYVEFSRIVSGATVVAVVDVVLLTALSTIGAFLYNITAALVGGVTLTLTDD